MPLQSAGLVVADVLQIDAIQGTHPYLTVVRETCCCLDANVGVLSVALGTTRSCGAVWSGERRLGRRVSLSACAAVPVVARISCLVPTGTPSPYLAVRP